jgi:hypothetical protein
MPFIQFGIPVIFDLPLNRQPLYIRTKTQENKHLSVYTFS